MCGSLLVKNGNWRVQMRKSIYTDLSEMLGLEVDMVTPQALSKYIKDGVLQQAETIYER